MARPFVIENDRERKRLQTLLAGLTEADLTQPIGQDWTVAIALAHLATWDQRAFILMLKWKEEGVSPNPLDIDVFNETLLPLWSALPARTAAGLALSASEAIDQELEKAPDWLIQDIEKLGESYRLYRSEHRKLHLDEIEKTLRNKRKG
jgi:hypothetical protein